MDSITYFLSDVTTYLSTYLYMEFLNAYVPYRLSPLLTDLLPTKFNTYRLTFLLLNSLLTDVFPLWLTSLLTNFLGYLHTSSFRLAYLKTSRLSYSPTYSLGDLFHYYRLSHLLIHFFTYRLIYLLNDLRAFWRCYCLQGLDTFILVYALN
jgi:hypothetical protein